MRYTQEYWDDIKEVIGHIPNIDKLKNSKVLITGATGMICSSVVEVILYLNKECNAGVILYLAGRNKERNAERFDDFEEGTDYYFVQYDATKESDLDIDVDYIIHGASNANPEIYSKQPVETILGNIVGINSLLAMASRKNVKRLLYISSSEVYGNKKDNHPYCEDDYGFVDILNPRACYPNGKRTAETLCVAYGDEYGIDTVVVRPGHIYGPTITSADTRASAQFTRNVLAGANIIMKSAGAQLRSYCYTLDCASAILTVLLNGEKGTAYNISNKDSVVTIRELAEALADYAGTKIVFNNPSDAEVKGYNLMPNSSLDATKLESLGWTACFDLKTGVKRTIDTLHM